MPIERIRGGINPAWRFGNKFVKHVAHGGSPFAEAATSKGFSLLGVPHNPVVATNLKKPLLVPGELKGTGSTELRPEHHLTVSPFLPMKSLSDVGKDGNFEVNEHLGSLMNHRQHLNTLLAEWIHSVHDRHSGNYAHIPEHGIISIDHGESFHPGTSMFHKGDPDAWFALKGNPEQWSVSPSRSALHSLMMHHPFSESMPRSRGDNQLIQKALANREKLQSLAHEGLHGFTEGERQLAVRAMENRLNVLHSHANSPLTYELLHDMHNEAIRRAKGLA